MAASGGDQAVWKSTVSKGKVLHSQAREIIWNVYQFFEKQGIITSKADLQPDIIALHGYTPEVHHVTTGDGYSLELHRVCQNNGTCSGKPVLIQHGLQTSSVCWVLNTPDKILPYFLLKAGFDLWLGNYRGNEYGEKHRTLSPDSKEFWQFSLDEMAKYDLPAMIDYILKINGDTSLSLVGHSMGTTGPFAMLSTLPEYNKKVKVLAAVAPVAYMEFMKSPLRLLALDNALALTLLNDFTNGKFTQSTPLTLKLTGAACSIVPLSCVACSSVYFATTGFDYYQMNMSRIDLYLSYLPSNCSVNTVKQYLQEVTSNKFCMFDHGTEGNMAKYNQPTPPDYDLRNIKTKVALFWGKNDWLAAPDDVKKLPPLLGSNLVLNYEVPFKQFSHSDFVIAEDVIKLVYTRLLKLLLDVASGAL